MKPANVSEGVQWQGLQSRLEDKQASKQKERAPYRDKQIHTNQKGKNPHIRI